MEFGRLPVGRKFTIQHEGSFVGAHLMGYLYEKVSATQARFLAILPGFADKHEYHINSLIGLELDFCIAPYPEQGALLHQGAA